MRANLEGFQEVPAISTVASGRFRAWVDTKANTITWKLSYEGLEGDVTQSHVHFGQMSVNGGISFFLCSNLGMARPGHQLCPAGPAEITGVITADQVIGPGAPAGTPGQGIEPGAFAEIVAAIRERHGLRQRPLDASGRAAKSAASCAKSGPNGLRPAPRKGAGRGLPYNFDQKLSPPA